MSKWGGVTLAALVAVMLIFGDALLTVEVHRVSLEADRLTKQLDALSLELGALESQWASRSSRLELEAKASELGLRVPKPDQVVLLPSSFLEIEPPRGPYGPAELRGAFVGNWIRLSSMGIP